MRTKIFYGSDFLELEKRIQEFLTKFEHAIEIKHICQSQSLDECQEEFLTISLWFDPTSQ